MTRIAFFRGYEVSGIFSRGDHTVVTGRTGSQHLCVVDGIDGRPQISAMTILAHVGRLHVRRSLSSSIGAVVAAETIVNNIDVIEKCRQPGHGGVAVIAIIAAGNVRRIFPGSDRAVMAGTAGTDNLSVVDGVDRCPDNIVVAIFTNIGGLDVRWIFSGGSSAVVASRAACDDAGMIEVSRDPRYGRMAIVTVVAAGNVRRVFPGSDDAVMAGTTGAQYLSVIDAIGGRPQTTVVAILAHIGGLNMGWILTGGCDTVVTA